MLAQRIRILVATFWAGSLWTIGYLVAPVLFSTLADRVLAGTIAGTLFRVEAWVSVACAAILWLQMLNAGKNAAGAGGRRGMILVLAMLACTVLGYFALQPFMAELRAAAGPGGVMASQARTRFAVLHGVSSAFYLVQSLLAVWLILKLRDARRD